tara:strand:+ start:4631 stop:4906 length:276 start_codon:yes stop_codon:yes gene_type:complete
MLHDNDYDTTYGAALVLIMAKQMLGVSEESETDEVTIMTELLDSWADNLLHAILYTGIPAEEVVETAERLDTHVKARYILDKSFEEEEPHG